MQHTAASPAVDVPAATGWLNRAIARHERHMNGTEPTTGPAGEASQQKMMDEMRAAAKALGVAPPTGTSQAASTQMNMAMRRGSGRG